MGYRINVPEYGEIAKVYSNMAEEYTYALKQFYQDIYENCEKCKYQPMVDFVNQICAFYYGDFQQHLNEQFNNWENSEYSLDKLLRNIGAGDDAVNVGRNYMRNIEETLNRLFNDASLAEIQMDTSEPEIDNNTIDRNNGYIRKFLKSAESALKEASDEVDAHAKNNDAFYCIQGIVNTTGKSMIECFNEMLSQVDHGNELFDLGGGKSVEPASEDSGDVISADGSMIWPFDDPFI